MDKNDGNGDGNGVDESPPERLVELIKSGSNDAANELARRYWTGLVYVLNRRLRDRDLAADFAQETFCIVISKIRNGEISKPASIKSFIRNVGINLVRNYWKQEESHKTSADTDLVMQKPDDSPSAIDRLSQEDKERFVAQVLSELTMDRDKNLLTRYYLLGEDKPTICSALDMTPAQFDRVKHRALRRLREIAEAKLKGLDPDDNGKDLLIVLLLVGPMLMIFGVEKPAGFAQMGEIARLEHSIDSEPFNPELRRGPIAPPGAE